MDHRLRSALFVLPALLGTACAHARLQVPAPDSPRDERVEAWRRLRPQQVDRVVELHNGLERPLWIHSVTLGDGQEVSDPTDLLPAVSPDSATARHVARYQQRSRTWNVWGGIAASTFGLITIPLFMAAARAIAVASGNSQALGWSSAPAWSAVFFPCFALSVGGPLVSLVVGAITGGNANIERDLAFRAYQADLHHHLFGPGETDPPLPRQR